MNKKINFKKLLPIVGLLAVATPAVVSVVACGTTHVKDQTLSWDLNAYNDGRENKILIERNLVSDSQSLDELLIKQLWTGMFDADEATAMERFNDQEVDQHLKMTSNLAALKAVLMFHSANKEIKSFEFKNLGLNLDADLNAKTDKENPKDYILKASKTSLNSLTIAFTKNGNEETVIDEAKAFILNEWNEFIAETIDFEIDRNLIDPTNEKLIGDQMWNKVIKKVFVKRLKEKISENNLPSIYGTSAFNYVPQGTIVSGNSVNPQVTLMIYLGKDVNNKNVFENIKDSSYVRFFWHYIN